MGLEDEDHKDVVMALQKSFSSVSVQELTDALSQAKQSGLEMPDAWTDSSVALRGRSFILAAKTRLEQLEEKEHIDCPSPGDVEWHIRILISLLCPSFTRFLDATLVDTLRERCKALRRQVTLCRPLRVCLRFDGVKALKKVMGDVKLANLEDPAAWILPEGSYMIA